MAHPSASLTEYKKVESSDSEASPIRRARTVLPDSTKGMKELLTATLTTNEDAYRRPAAQTGAGRNDWQGGTLR
jgi:hypothetical protein